MDPSEKVAVPSPQPSPPKGIGGVDMMHGRGEGAEPAASWLMGILWQLAQADRSLGCLILRGAAEARQLLG
jgi:hypothetical protein